MAENSVAAYKSDWADFCRWCHEEGRLPLPADPATVADYLADQAQQYAATTVARRLSTINKIHCLGGVTPPGHHPAVTAVLAGIRRVNARPPRQMKPLMADDLLKVIAAMEFSTSRRGGTADRRDACMLVFGFGGAFRRSELSTIRLGDLRWHATDGITAQLLRSKTDQEGRGLRKALPFGHHPLTCPPCVLARWLGALTSDPESDAELAPVLGHVCQLAPPALDLDPQRWLFPSLDQSGTAAGSGHITGAGVNAVVKRRLKAAGISPEGYGSHSLRAGFVTQALRNGATDAQVMRQTGHRSPTTVHIYDRENNPLHGNAVTRIGL